MNEINIMAKRNQISVKLQTHTKKENFSSEKKRDVTLRKTIFTSVELINTMIITWCSKFRIVLDSVSN